MFWIIFYLLLYCGKDNKEYLSSPNKYIDNFFLLYEIKWLLKNPKFDSFTKFNRLEITNYILGVLNMVLISVLIMSFVRIISLRLKLVVDVTTRGHYIENEPQLTDTWNNFQKSRTNILMFWNTFYISQYCGKDNEEYSSSPNKYI